MCKVCVFARSACVQDVSAGEVKLILSILPSMCKTYSGRCRSIISITLQLFH